MKIRTIELFQVPPRWLFLKMTTESGIVGWGEPVVEGRAETVAACVREMAPFLIGKSAGEIEDTFQMLYRAGFYRGGPILTSALSGIEQAMWDIKGKYLNVRSMNSWAARCATGSRSTAGSAATIPGTRPTPPGKRSPRV